MAAFQLDAEQNLFRGPELFEHPRFVELSPEALSQFLVEVDVEEGSDLAGLYVNHFNSIRSHAFESNFRGLQSL